MSLKIKLLILIFLQSILLSSDSNKKINNNDINQISDSDKKIEKFFYEHFAYDFLSNCLDPYFLAFMSVNQDQKDASLILFPEDINKNNNL